MRVLRFLLLSSILGVVLVRLATAVLSDDPANQDARAQLQKTFSAGNYKDAYEGYRKLALDPADAPRQVGQDLNMATTCLRSLGRMDEIDDFREAVIAAHAKNWRLLQAAAQNYLDVEHHGYLVAGKFYRGNKRGGGRMVNAWDRDRVRALQLMVQAMPLARADENHPEVSDFYMALSRMLLANRGYSEAWRLQYLTDLGQLPDYEEGWYYGQSAPGAPVDAEGMPVFHTIPKSFETAASDGQRWRWCLEQAVEFSPQRTNEVRIEWANFLQQQFGVETMASYGYFFGAQETDDTKKDESGTYALHTLGEDETIARLATGIKRFKLPEEFNFIKIYQQVADDPKTGYGEQALGALAQIFENRRQYPRAAEFWRRSIKEYGPGPNNQKPQRLTQIVGNWGRFEGIMVQPAGKGATVEYRFRNGAAVHFAAHEILVDKLLADVKAYLSSNPSQLDWNRVNISELGYRLVQQNQKQYLGRQVAAWDLDLQPREKHFDKRVTVATPLQKAGAYLVSAQMADGNESQIIVWLADTVIVKKPLAGKTYYFVADAVTGKPIPRANVEFFGYWQENLGQNRFQVRTKDFAEFTDADGQIVLDPNAQQQNFQWIVMARAAGGRFAYLGFTNVWYGNYYDAEYNQTKVFTITDRPVYRPKQTVKFKLWVRHAKYDQEDTSSFANQSFNVEIVNPKGEKVLQKQFTADAYGGMDGELELPADATLGVYGLYVVNQGGGNFRVEEYKKPEYEVTVDAPQEPVMLGEKIAATIRAKYYFGSPVTKAKVKYKVTRTSATNQWYPMGVWDWLYGPGYWWYAYDYDWYPGWRQWGCRRPIPWWWSRGYQPPEVVADREVEIGADGTVKVEIDTAVAKAIHPDQDHQYQITAEVVDQSRRTIVGTGNVMVARKPFSVYAWVDRGYYRVGDTVRANFSARTLDNKPVTGEGLVTLLKISYNAKSEPVETPVRQWKLPPDEQGQAQLQLAASAAGQYRLSYKVTDGKKHTIEGGYVFTTIGEGFDGADYRFNHLELITEKREYQPGEKINLMVNTDRVGAAVLLFVRPANGVYLPPTVLRLTGKSTIHSITVTKKDMPNFFIEAVTIADGKLYTEAKEIVVPPEKRVVNVKVEPSAESYKPGQKATVKVTLTDLLGKPFVGSSVLAMYDKSVEYISGGSNVEDIKAFFWKWRRSHSPRTESTLDRYFGNLIRPGAPGMGNLGIFGETVADEAQAGDKEGVTVLRAYAPGGFGGGRSGGVAMRGMAMARRAGPGAEAANGMMADGAMAPMAAMAAPAAGEAKAAAEPGAPPPALVQPTVRTKFADTALWIASLTTDADGVANVTLDMPENLTAWKIKVWSMGHGTKVGEGSAEVVTRKDLILRMQTPRFFVQKDEVVLSANVHNYLKSAKSAQVVLEVDEKLLAPMDKLTRTVEIKPGEEARVDWRVKVLDEGEAVVRMKALTDEDSDAMEMRLPAYVHGMLKMDSISGAIRPEKAGAKFAIRVPAERRINQSRLEVRYSPTLAGAMVDALPYMVEYPYGCTEQTLNRFLPTVVTQKILLGMGLDLKAIRDKRTNLNAQEIGDDAERAKGWKRYERNPVFDEEEVRRMVKEGVQALTQMQLSDGGWGWFSGWQEQSWPHTTAYVVHGLQIAQQNDVALVPGVLERGVAWLTAYQNEQIRRLKNAPTKTEPYKVSADELDAFVYMVLVDAGVKNQEMMDFLYRDRTNLAVYTKAMFGLALEKQGERDKLAMILQNISQYVVQDEENQTAYLKLPEDNYWWCWYGSEYEAHAYYLKLLARTDPKGELASRLVKYLLNNRKHATYWTSTRDTAICLEAMADYLKASGESKPDMTVEIWMDGKKQKEVKITSENLFTFDNKFVLFGDAVETGAHEIEFKKRGQGPLYFNAYLTNFTLEDPIARAGLEVKVNRKYYKLVKADKQVKVAGSRGQAVDQKVEKYNREELKDLALLKSGDLVEIELEIDSKNDYEYLLFEDMKAAGFEPVEVQSGYNANDLGAYMELRDNRVVFFVRALARGKHSVAYRMRAEIPGKFSALPTRASAMYAPELKANSDELKLRIED
ncbi:MAG: alpha-2-macroglobulin family protein [Pirellulales bacterium]